MINYNNQRYYTNTIELDVVLQGYENNVEIEYFDVEENQYKTLTIPSTEIEVFASEEDKSLEDNQDKVAKNTSYQEQDEILVRQVFASKNNYDNYYKISIKASSKEKIKKRIGDKNLMKLIMDIVDYYENKSEKNIKEIKSKILKIKIQ